jgi:hypothetical protein
MSSLVFSSLADKTSEEQLQWLKRLTVEILKSGRSSVKLNGEEFPVYLASGSNQYPAFWTRDAVWSSMSGLVDLCDMQAMLRLLALTQNGAKTLQLANGLSVPPWSAADHVEREDGTPVWFPGVWKGGHDQGSGRFGMLPAQDANYMFIELAYLVAKESSFVDVWNENIGGVKLAERLERSFWAAEYDADTQLAYCTEETRAVAFSDAIIKTGFLLDGSLLRWRAAERIKLFFEANQQADKANEYAQIADSIRENLPRKLWHQTVPGKEGWLYSASEIARHDCVRGTSFALALGILDPEHAAMASQALVSASCAPETGALPEDGMITYLGHMRHLRKGEYWDDTPMEHNSYQNGGYWAMFTGWYLGGISGTQLDFAQRTLAVMVDYLEQFNFYDGKVADKRGAPYEWILPDGTVIGPKYLPSLTLLWTAMVGGFKVR